MKIFVTAESGVISVPMSRCPLCRHRGPPCWEQNVTYDRSTGEPRLICEMTCAALKFWLHNCHDNFKTKHMAWQRACAERESEPAMRQELIDARARLARKKISES